MKFIRKGGRIIPIREKGEDSRSKKILKSTAIGLGSGASIGGLVGYTAGNALKRAPKELKYLWAIKGLSKGAIYGAGAGVAIGVASSFLPKMKSEKQIKSSSDKIERSLTREDYLMGIGSGFATKHFSKKPRIALGIGVLSVAHGLSTTARRVREHGLGKGVWEDFKAGIGKGIFRGVGVSSARVANIGVGKIRPYSKKMGSSLGDMSHGFKEKYLVKRPKDIDLSKGAKTFKGKSNQLSGLLGYNK